MAAKITINDIFSVVSLCASLGAAAFTGLQWHEAREQLNDAREQNKLTVKLLATPKVGFYVQADEDELPVGIQIINHGPGVASIKSVIYYVDGKPVKSMEEAETFKKINSDLIKEITLANGDSLSASESSWLIYSSDKNKKELKKFAEFIDEHVAVLVKYCSLNYQCWQQCSDPGHC